MKLYKCLTENKILTEKALFKGVCAGHRLIEYSEPEKVLKVAISIPTEGHTLPEAYDNHLLQSFRLGCYQERWRYEKRNPRYEFYFYSTGRLLTQMAREKLVRVALKADMDYIVMYDDDMILPADMVLRLLEDVEAHPEIDVLAPLAFQRTPPYFPVMYIVTEGYDPIRHTDYYANEVQENYPKDKLVECDAVGFGAVIINMNLIRKMKEPYFMSTTPTGEDIMFCVNAKKQANARIFMDTRIKLGHISSPPIIDELFVEKWRKTSGHKIQEKKHKYAIDEYDISHDLLALDR